MKEMKNMAAPAACLHQIQEPAPVLAAQHPDDEAVDALSALMKAKLAKQRAKGYGGWDTDCTRERLSDLLRGHVDKGDPVDVANFCAFLSARGEGIAPQAAPAAVAVPDERWYPDVCPITGRRFFGWIEHWKTGQDVPTYGGPFDSYTIPVKDEDGTFSCERFDHDAGEWMTEGMGWCCLGLMLADDQAFVVQPGNPRYDEIRDFAEDRAALAATPAAAAPAGWKLVPIEPTAEMLESAGATDRDGTPATYKTLYMAMVGASPAAAPVVLPEPDFHVRPASAVQPHRALMIWDNDATSEPAYFARTVRALLATATGLPAQAVDAVDPVQAAADAASVGHLSHLIDHQSQILARAMAAMKAVESTAAPIDESHGDLDARIPYEAWATFVDARAALLHDVAQSPVAATQAQADARDAAFEAVRKKFCKLQRYSFFLDDKGNVRRTPDYCGNWVEFEAVHTLFEPAAVDAAIAAQAAQGGEHDGAK